jgi:sulfur-carrier protein
MIKINLKLFVTLSKYLPEGSEDFEVPENTSVKTIISDLGIEHKTVKLIFVNGKKQDDKYILKNSDRLGLFPPVGGG